MAVTATHGGPKRAPFLPAARSSAGRLIAPQRLRSVRLAASGGFRPDHSAGAGASQTDATAPASASATYSSTAHTPASLLVPYFVSFWGHLRDHASALAQHLSAAEQASFLPSLGLGVGPHAHMRAAADAGASASSATEARGGSGLAAWPLLPPVLHHVPPLQPRGLDTSRPLSPRQQHDLQDPPQQQQQPQHQHADDGHFWTGPLTHLPWSHGAALPNVEPAGPGASDSTSASATPSPPPSSAQLDPSLGPNSGAHHHQPQRRLAAQTAGLALLWHSALSLQQRALMTALWRMGQAVEAADKARRNIPPPAEVPGLVHWGAVAAAARAEEAVALALAHTAMAASAAAAGVPAAAAAVTGSAAAAAAAAAVTAPHLPLLRHARRRLLAAARPMLERLRGLQRGCTTHVLLRFLLFSALNPRMRRELRIRLDVLARRAAQVALLQEQHDAWLARQLEQPPTHGSVPPAAAAATATTASTPTPLSARWYRRVFAPEMLACARQLELEAPAAGGATPNDRAAGDPSGRFDLRDLYRLVRVIDVAVEDLERYQ